MTIHLVLAVLHHFGSLNLLKGNVSHLLIGGSRSSPLNGHQITPV